MLALHGLFSLNSVFRFWMEQTVRRMLVFLLATFLLNLFLPSALRASAVGPDSSDGSLEVQISSKVSGTVMDGPLSVVLWNAGGKLSWVGDWGNPEDQNAYPLASIEVVLRLSRSVSLLDAKMQSIEPVASPISDIYSVSLPLNVDGAFRRKFTIVGNRGDVATLVVAARISKDSRPFLYAPECSSLGVEVVLLPELAIRGLHLVNCRKNGEGVLVGVKSSGSFSSMTLTQTVVLGGKFRVVYDRSWESASWYDHFTGVFVYGRQASAGGSLFTAKLSWEPAIRLSRYFSARARFGGLPLRDLESGRIVAALETGVSLGLQGWRRWLFSAGPNLRYVFGSPSVKALGGGVDISYLLEKAGIERVVLGASLFALPGDTTREISLGVGFRF